MTESGFDSVDESEFVGSRILGKGVCQAAAAASLAWS